MRGYGAASGALALTAIPGTAGAQPGALDRSFNPDANQSVFAVNLLAVVWGLSMALNLAWPREAIYGTPWYNTWGAFVYITVILGSGLAWYGLRGRQRIGVLDSHAAQ